MGEEKKELQDNLMDRCRWCCHFRSLHKSELAACMKTVIPPKIECLPLMTKYWSWNDVWGGDQLHELFPYHFLLSPRPSFLWMIYWPKNLLSSFPLFLFVFLRKSFLRTSWPFLNRSGLACFLSYCSFCFFYAFKMFAFASSNFRFLSCSICVISGSSMASYHSVSSLGVDFRISKSIGNVAWRPNIKQNSVNLEESWHEVL